jgi:hypothetical protein
MPRVLGGFILASACSLSPSAEAEEKAVQVGAYGGYQFGGSVSAGGATERVSLDIQDAPSAGATLDIRVRPGAYAELAYSYQDTDVTLRSPSAGSEQYALTIQHFTIGGVFQYKLAGSEWIRPIFGGTVGAARYGASEEGYSFEKWYVSLLFEGGLAFRIIDNLGLRFRGRLLTTFLTSDSALFCGTQVGCSVAFSGVGLFQGDVSGGAYLAF